MQKILFDTFKGKIILLLYDRNGELDESDQKQLVDIISSYLLCFIDALGFP